MTAAKKQVAEQSRERVSREQETWDNIDIHASMTEIEGSFGPLPEIPAREGFAQRWIRTKLNGNDDPGNVSKAINQHWRRRDPSTLPATIAAPSVYVEGIGDTIGISGMVLMERPLKIHDQYKDRVNNRKKAQMQAVDSSLYTTHSADDEGFGAPSRVEDKTKVKIGGGMPVDD